MENQRLILFVVLAFLLLMLWQQWVEYSNPQPKQQTASDVSQSSANSTEAARQNIDNSVPGAPSMADAGTAVSASQIPQNNATAGIR